MDIDKRQTSMKTGCLEVLCIEIETDHFSTIHGKNLQNLVIGKF